MAAQTELQQNLGEKYYQSYIYEIEKSRAATEKLRAEHISKTEEYYYQRYISKTSDLRAEYLSETSDLRAEYSAETNDLRAEHSSEIMTLRAEHSSEIMTLLDEHSSKTANLREENFREHLKIMKRHGNMKYAYALKLEILMRYNKDFHLYGAMTMLVELYEFDHPEIYGDDSPTLNRKSPQVVLDIIASTQKEFQKIAQEEMSRRGIAPEDFELARKNLHRGWSKHSKRESLELFIVNTKDHSPAEVAVYVSYLRFLKHSGGVIKWREVTNQADPILRWLGDGPYEDVD